jgi:hypothetical protein
VQQWEYRPTISSLTQSRGIAAIASVLERAGIPLAPPDLSHVPSHLREAALARWEMVQRRRMAEIARLRQPPPETEAERRLKAALAVPPAERRHHPDWRVLHPTVECGAKARSRGGAPCRRPAYPNGRCRNHGGLCTGARTVEGRARCAENGRRGSAARWRAPQPTMSAM